MVHQVNDSDFEKQLKRGGIVVVKFFASWCGSCKLFAPKFRRISEEDRYSEITFLDINAEDNEKARKTAGVDNLPFLAVFKDGELLEGSATSKEEYLHSMIEKAQ